MWYDKGNSKHLWYLFFLSHQNSQILSAYMILPQNLWDNSRRHVKLIDQFPRIRTYKCESLIIRGSSKQSFLYRFHYLRVWSLLKRTVFLPQGYSCKTNITREQWSVKCYSTFWRISPSTKKVPEVDWFRGKGLHSGVLSSPLVRVSWIDDPYIFWFNIRISCHSLQTKVDKI